MKKVSYINSMPFQFAPARKGAKYSFDGGKTWKNNGEFLESCAKFHRGLDYLINPSTSYDSGSDIESLNASIKSSGASLACIYGDFETILKIYFNNVHSTLWIYMVAVDDTIIEYHMNKTEFEEFLRAWAGLAVESGSHLTKVRIKKTSGKMIKWLEDRVA